MASRLQAAEPSSPKAAEICSGPFQPTWESLKQYKCPAWFRDAKFGIWAHWGPQSAAKAGDWYARKIYQQEDPVYHDHVKNFGHPSKFGYKDIISLWKAEKWDPDRLLALYKKAGARYFVGQAVHSDNFDLWNSKYQPWNSVDMGPKRDIVGDWQKAAKKHGLPFDVSEHIGNWYEWFLVSHGSDKTGSLAGVPYDGADPKYQGLYHPPIVNNDRYGWDRANEQDWRRRMEDLIDHYHPDFMYVDGGVPCGQIGLGIVARLLNDSCKRHGGKVEAVFTHKGNRPTPLVRDLEIAVFADIYSDPWQTDVSIGGWSYDEKARESNDSKYKKVDWVIHTLVDIVSKNGNLLLNIVQLPDGSIEPELEQLLNDLGDWMAVNGEAIYGTRPWRVFGEGTVFKADGGVYNVKGVHRTVAHTYKDVRFTVKDKTLYAVVLGWPPEGQFTIKSLAKGTTLAGGEISDIRLLGYDGKVDWTRDTQGLTIRLPAQKTGKRAFAFKITGLVL
jgi:alpha-L-fucosidase